MGGHTNLLLSRPPQGYLFLFRGKSDQNHARSDRTNECNGFSPTATSYQSKSNIQKEEKKKRKKKKKKRNLYHLKHFSFRKKEKEKKKPVVM